MCVSKKIKCLLLGMLLMATCGLYAQSTSVNAGVTMAPNMNTTLRYDMLPAQYYTLNCSAPYASNDNPLIVTVSDGYTEKKYTLGETNTGIVQQFTQTTIYPAHKNNLYYVDVKVTSYGNRTGVAIHCHLQNSTKH